MIELLTSLLAGLGTVALIVLVVSAISKFNEIING